MRLRNDRVAPVSRAGERVLAIANFLLGPFIVDDNKRSFRRDAETSTRDACAPQNSRTRAGDYSPKRWRNCARTYSRFSFAIKLALISAGHTASHS
jgi:hypothetical protein